MHRAAFGAFLVVVSLIACNLSTAFADELVPSRATDGVVPKKDGRELNLGFETGTLLNWTAEGDAFVNQPVEGDTVRPRLVFVSSQHAGNWWIGGYEKVGDQPQGTLTSDAFEVTHPFASFLVSGGASDKTRVEIVRADTGRVVFRASGDNSEILKPVAVDLQPHFGAKIFIRLIDQESGSWGHINFDDFRFHDKMPDFPKRDNATATDEYQYAGLPPEEAAKAMTVPEGFSVTLFAGEPDVKQPIAMAIDDRGRLWIAEAYSYPARVPDDQARDRILIFEDSNGDGKFDSRKVFADKLNLVSGLEVGFGGVWVGAAPYLLFIPDADQDDVPDSEPQILLDGWGMQDTHETLNTFMWGPDGWLYGCHGVFTHSRVGKPGTPDEQRIPLNAAVWRYHPTRHEFEVFAHGTSNPWGIDFNDRGQAFITACVIPHLYHIIHNGRYFRQAGGHEGHFNPHTYRTIETIALHRHWIGATPHSGNNRSDAAGGGHAHAGAMIYLGGAWPKEYHDQIFMNNIHGARLNLDSLAPRGSGYVGDRLPDFLLANDTWSQILNMQYGPDGHVYMIDWYDRNQCHRMDRSVHDATNGRIFKIVYGDPKPVKVDLAKLSNKELVEHLLNENDWYVRHARRLLQERAPAEDVRDQLLKIAFEHEDETRRLRGLWALHVTSGLNDELLMRGLADESPWVRGWCVQLACERGEVSSELLSQFVKMAADDPSQVVRLYLAAEAQSLPHERRWDLLAALTSHSDDVGDHNLPLMYWYALEPLAAINPSRALRLATDSPIPLLGAFTARRVAGLGTPESVALLSETVGRQTKASAQLNLLKSINEAYRGARRIDMPAGWPEVFARLRKSDNPEVVSQALTLATTFGDPVAFTAMQEILVDTSADFSRRKDAIRALLKARAPDLAPVLHRLLDDPTMRIEALRALSTYDHPDTAKLLLDRYPDWNAAEKRESLGVLVGRKNSAEVLMTAIEEKRLPSTDLSADLVRQLRSHNDEALNARIENAWGRVQDTPEDKLKAIADWKRKLRNSERTADVALGRAVFARTCQQCHKLFDAGSDVGPELTGSNRADLDYLLSNVIDPSAVIGKDYQATTIVTSDGRLLTGLVKGEDDRSLTLVTATETVVLPKDEIDERELSDKSMMPDDILKPLSDAEVAALVAYLASPRQTPMLATPDNVGGFFNGRDLTNWSTKDGAWKVDQEQLIANSEGELLKSDLLLSNFRLTFDAKLPAEGGKLALLLRAETLDDGSLAATRLTIASDGAVQFANGAKGNEKNGSARASVKAGEWNAVEVVARDDRFVVSVDGKNVAELKSAEAARRGVLAFEAASQSGETRLRNLKIELLPAGVDSATAAR